MPAIKKIDLPQMYAKARQEGNLAGEEKDCAVIAVAAACKVPYETARKELANQGRADKKGTPFHMTRKSVEALGFKLNRVWQDEIMNRLPEPHRRVLKNLTTHHPRRFPGSFDANKAYLVFVKGHVLAIVDGVVADWSINNSLRIQDIYEVVKA